MSSRLNPVQQLYKGSVNPDSNPEERVPLLGKKACDPWSTLRRRYGSTRKCISSKGALAILMWTFTMTALYYMLLDPAIYTKQHVFGNSSILNICVYGGIAITLCLYPIAGYIADNKYSRFKTAVVGLWILLPSFVFLIIYLLSVFALHILANIPRLIIATTIPAVSGILLSISSVIFYANVIQLGVDQLYDFPAEDQSLFIHWYVWVFYLAASLTQFSSSARTIQRAVINEFAHLISSRNFIFSYVGYGITMLLAVVTFVFLVVSLSVAHCKRHWFLIEPSRVNPYKLVYKVTKFAWRHKVPVRRSAFTYCEDDIPSGLDLAKSKYGGPFTTEQVEDVKVFYGILKILFSLGPVFFLTFAADETLYQFTLHGSIFRTPHSNLSNFSAYNTEPLKILLIQHGLLTPLVTVICIPLYLFLLRPFLAYYIPGMLKRIGIGASLTVLSLMCTTAIGAWAHTRYNAGCMFDLNSVYITLNDTLDDSLDPASVPGPFYDISLVAIQRILQSFSDMFLYIALYEFICSQSPHSMKGLLIGLSFAIKGLFHIIAAVLALPFALAMNHTHISCGVSYYIMNSGVGVVAVLVYTYIARKYRNRERDEPSNIYMYAENYYSKGPPDE